jgi:hypothetical protein
MKALSIGIIVCIVVMNIAVAGLCATTHPGAAPDESACIAALAAKVIAQQQLLDEKAPSFPWSRDSRE